MENQVVNLGKGVNARIVNIDPEHAKHLLKKNLPNNRKLDQARINQYALDMKEGYWKFNAIPILLDKEGNLIDGQHRLHAVIQSGVSVEMLVIGNLDNSDNYVFNTVDTGKNRNGTDALTMLEIDRKKASTLSAFIKRVFQYEQGRIGMAILNSSGSYPDRKIEKRMKMNNQQIDEYYKKNKAEYDYVYDFFVITKEGKKKSIREMMSKRTENTYPIFIFYLLQKINRDQAEKFFIQLAYGEKLELNDPAYALREKLLEIKNNRIKLPGWHYPALYFKAWNAFRTGKKIERLYIASNEKTPVKPI